MPQPDMRSTIVAGPLQNVSIQYKNKSYIADKVFPILNDVAPKAKIARYLKGAWFRDEAAIRGPGTKAARGGYPTDYLTINTVEYAFAKEVTDEDRKYAKVAGAPPLKPDQDAIEFCSDKIDLKKERRVAAEILAGTWSGVTAGEDAAGLWAPNDNTNTFVLDMLERSEYIRSQTGFKPNVLVMDAGTYNKLKMNDALLERIKYTQRGVLSSDLIAAMFDLDQVLIGEAIYSTAKENKAGTDFTAQNIWEKNAGKGSAFLFYRAPSIGLKVPTAGLQARVKYDNGGSYRRLTTWREAAEHQDVYEAAEETDIVQTGADLGFLWADTLLT